MFFFSHTYPWLLLFQICASYRSCSIYPYDAYCSKPIRTSDSSSTILFLIRVTSPTHQFVCSFFVYIYTSVLYTSSRALVNIQTSVLFPCISLYKLSSVSDPYISARAIPFHTHTLEWSHSIHIRSSDPVPYTSARAIPFHTHPLEWSHSIHIRSSDPVPYTSSQVIPFHTHPLEWSHSINIRSSDPVPYTSARVIPFHTHPLEWSHSIHIRSSDPVPYIYPSYSSFSLHSHTSVPVLYVDPFYCSSFHDNLHLCVFGFLIHIFPVLHVCTRFLSSA